MVSENKLLSKVGDAPLSVDYEAQIEYEFEEQVECMPIQRMSMGRIIKTMIAAVVLLALVWFTVMNEDDTRDLEVGLNAGSYSPVNPEAVQDCDGLEDSKAMCATLIEADADFCDDKEVREKCARSCSNCGGQ